MSPDIFDQAQREWEEEPEYDDGKCPCGCGQRKCVETQIIEMEEE